MNLTIQVFKNLKLLRLFAVEFCIDNLNRFNIFLYVMVLCREEDFDEYLLMNDFTYHYCFFHFFFNQYFSPKSVIFPWVENFLLSWKFSVELRIFPWVENFLLSWELSLELRILSWIENFLSSWEFSFELKIFSEV